MRGSVQGVFFRESCRRQAEAAGVAGWVRNRADGAVEAVFEGRTDAVDAVVAWCGAGPRYGHVESVEVSNEDPVGSSGFEIRG